MKIKILSKVDELDDNMQKTKKSVDTNIQDFANKLNAKTTKNGYAIDEVKVSLSLVEKRMDKKIDDKFLFLEKKIDRIIRNLELNQRNQEKEFKAFKEEGSNILKQIGDINDKVFEIEENKRNNLVFFGITNDTSETYSSLNQKVLNNIKKVLKRNIPTFRSRIYLGYIFK